MKPFNLEEAKAGKPFCWERYGNRSDVKTHFVGVRDNGEIAYETKFANEQGKHWYMSSAPESELQMITEKKTFKVYLLRNKQSGVVFATEGHPGPNYEILGEHTFEWEE